MICLSTYKMKHLTYIILFISLSLNAQDRFTLSAYTEPFADKNTTNQKLDFGFNAGARIEYQMQWVYFQAEVYVFPELNGKDYFDFDGGIGFNYRNRWDNLRIYSGAKLGVINRKGWGHAKYGFEAGIEYYFNNGFYLGAQLGRTWREDGKVTSSNDEGYWTYDNGIRIGITL